MELNHPLMQYVYEGLIKDKRESPANCWIDVEVFVLIKYWNDVWSSKEKRISMKSDSENDEILAVGS